MAVPVTMTITETKKISELPAAASAAPTDQLETNQSGTSRRVTVQQLIDAMSLGGGPVYPARGVLYASGTTGNTPGKSDPARVSYHEGNQVFRIQTTTDGPMALHVNGLTKGMRVVTNATAVQIEGVDQTGTGSYQPLQVNGSDLRFGAPSEYVRLTATGLHVGIDGRNATSKLHARGLGGTTAAIDTASLLGATVYAQDSGATVGNGGMVMFGASQGAFAAFKGMLVSGSNNTTGDVVISTRRLATDATLTETMRVRADGVVTFATTPTFTTGGFLPLTGGTLTGTVNTQNILPTADKTYTLGSSTQRVQHGWFQYANASDIAGANAGYYIKTGALGRWLIAKNTAAEGGSNAGADLTIYRYDDAGSVIAGGAPFTITRSTGSVAIPLMTNGTVFREGAGSGVTAGTAYNNLVIDSDGSLGMTFASPNTQTPTIAFADPESNIAGYISYNHATDTMELGAAAAQRLAITTGTFLATGNPYFLSGTAVPAGGTASLGYRFSSATNFGMFFGSGAPTLSAAQGSIYLRSDGAPYYNLDGATAWDNLAPRLVQTQTFQTGAVATGTTQIPIDDTIPQQTEGDQYMSLAITPRSATSKLVIDVVINVASSITGQNNMTAALFQDSTANALAAVWSTTYTNGAAQQIKFTHTMTSGTTSATTFKVRAGANAAGTTTFNGTAGARLFGGVMASSMVIREVL